MGGRGVEERGDGEIENEGGKRHMREGVGREGDGRGRSGEKENGGK